jgi:hypothetical protein
MDTDEVVANEVDQWPSSRNTSTTDLDKSNAVSMASMPMAEEVPRLVLVNVSSTIRVGFRQVPEMPEHYVYTMNVTPTMTARSVLTRILHEFTLRPGHLSGDEKDKKSVKYVLNEVCVQPNGQQDARAMADEDVPLTLRMDAQALLQNRQLYDHYFQLTVQESWLSRMNVRLKEKMRPQNASSQKQST